MTKRSPPHVNKNENNQFLIPNHLKLFKYKFIPQHINFLKKEQSKTIQNITDHSRNILTQPSSSNRLPKRQVDVRSSPSNSYKRTQTDRCDRSACLNQLASYEDRRVLFHRVKSYLVCYRWARLGSCTGPGLIFRARSRKYNDSSKKAQVRPSWQRLPTNQRAHEAGRGARRGRKARRERGVQDCTSFSIGY